MQTQNIVQTSANVIRITNLKIGDLYKRYTDSSYDNSLFYGIVKSIDNNGEQTFIHAIEYKKSYSEISASVYIIRGDKEVAIFPATIQEIQDEFGSVVAGCEKEIEKLQKQIAEKERIITDTESLLNGTLAHSLQTPEYRELTQSDYAQKKLLAKEIDF